MSPVSGDSKVFGIFGDPVQHSLSPQMHHAAFEAFNLPHVYLPFRIASDQLEAAVDAIRVLGIQGINVTIPHKEKIMPYLDEIDAEAEKIGAVNTIKNENGRLIGFNTDGLGFVASLMESGIDPADRAVLLLGAGGAAKGVAMALLSAGTTEIHVCARRAAAAEALAKRLRNVSPHSQITARGDTSGEEMRLETQKPVLLINSTPLGMHIEDGLPFPVGQIKGQWVVADLIYRPYETPLLLAAKKVNATIVPGLGMLLHQGTLAFEIWTGLKAPTQVMRQALWQAFSKDTP
jgi:shikimate dehydrogenase